MPRLPSREEIKAEWTRRYTERSLSEAERGRLEKAREYQNDFAAFARAAWQVLEPATPLIWNWHLDLICEYLTLAKRRQIRRLIINVPPQTMKSRLVTTLYPAWTWCEIPSRRFMTVSYSESLSTAHSIESRNVLKSQWFQELWPGNVQFAADQDKKTEYENLQGGRRIATSITGTATGKGVHDVIVDDPLNPKQAASDAERASANDCFDATLRTRLSDQISGVFIIVMQRLHEQDLTGHLLAKEPGVWTQLSIPMIAESDERWEFPISGRVVERKAGELLWPARFPESVVEALKSGMGSSRFAGQMQQRPSPAGGGIIQRGWWKFWKELPAKFDAIIQSWDCTFKDTQGSDYVVGQVWGKAGASYYLIDQVRGRMDFVATKNAVKSLSAKHPQAITKLVEDKANGPAIISSLKAEVDGIIAVNPEGSKEARASAVSPLIEAGNVFLPDPSLAPWVHDFIEECAAFPKGAHDDQVDAMSQALHRLRSHGGGVFGWYQQQAAKIEEKKEAAQKGMWGR